MANCNAVAFEKENMKPIKYINCVSIDLNCPKYNYEPTQSIHRWQDKLQENELGI